MNSDIRVSYQNELAPCADQRHILDVVLLLELPPLLIRPLQRHVVWIEDEDASRLQPLGSMNRTEEHIWFPVAKNAVDLVAEVPGVVGCARETTSSLSSGVPCMSSRYCRDAVELRAHQQQNRRSAGQAREREDG